MKRGGNPQEIFKSLDKPPPLFSHQYPQHRQIVILRPPTTVLCANTYVRIRSITDTVASNLLYCMLTKMEAEDWGIFYRFYYINNSVLTCLKDS